jgi:hypothetical protein
MVEPRHQRRFLAEIARQRHYLNIERMGGKAVGDRERRIGRAVVDIDDLAGKAVALPQRACEIAEALMQRRKTRRLVVNRHDDR